MKLSDGQEHTLRRLVQFGCLRAEEVDGRTLGALVNRGLVEQAAFKVYPSPDGTRWVEQNPPGTAPAPEPREKRTRRAARTARAAPARERRWNTPRETDLRLLRRLKEGALPLETLSRAAVVRAAGQGWVVLGPLVELSDPGERLLQEYGSGA